MLPIREFLSCDILCKPKCKITFLCLFLIRVSLTFVIFHHHNMSILLDISSCFIQCISAWNIQNFYLILIWDLKAFLYVPHRFFIWFLYWFSMHFCMYRTDFLSDFNMNFKSISACNVQIFYLILIWIFIRIPLIIIDFYSHLV